MQVTGAAVEGDSVKLTVEPAKGGESETIEADVVLVSAGWLTFMHFDYLYLLLVSAGESAHNYSTLHAQLSPSDPPHRSCFCRLYCGILLLCIYALSKSSSSIQESSLVCTAALQPVPPAY